MPTFEFLYTDVRMVTEAPDEDTARALVERDLDEVAMEYRFVKSL